MEKWNNGDRGETVKKIIDNNFEILDARVAKLADTRVIPFSTSDWNNGVIFIEYSRYNKQNPCVDLYIKNDSGYLYVYGGYEINNDGIRLLSDMAYNGKVVIR